MAYSLPNDHTSNNHPFLGCCEPSWSTWPNFMHKQGLPLCHLKNNNTTFIKCDSRNASTSKIKEPILINVNEHKPVKWHPHTTTPCLSAMGNSRGCGSWPWLCRGTGAMWCQMSHGDHGWPWTRVDQRTTLGGRYRVHMLLLMVAFALSMS